jgi:hypothetical protein
MRTSALLLIIALNAVAGLHLPAAARDAEGFSWDAADCKEVAGFLKRPQDDAVLAVTVYRCGFATVAGGEPIDKFSVSEITLLEGGTSTLLRQVTDHPDLKDRLRGLGVDVSHFGTIESIGSDKGEIPAVRVSFGRHSFTVGGYGGSSGTSPFPPGPGASSTYRGKKGTVKVAYVNGDHTFTPAAVSVTATHDDELASWMGTPSGSGPGIVVEGDWVGSAVPQP